MEYQSKHQEAERLLVSQEWEEPQEPADPILLDEQADTLWLVLVQELVSAQAQAWE